MDEKKADGVDFVYIPYKEPHKFKIVESYTRSEWIKGIRNYPKTCTLYWRNENGQKIYCDNLPDSIEIPLRQLDFREGKFVIKDEYDEKQL